MAALRELVVPPREREDQAAFLRSAADYIRQLQARASVPCPCCLHVHARYFLLSC
jgi:hypothetical protein